MPPCENLVLVVNAGRFLGYLLSVVLYNMMDISIASGL